MAKPANGTVIIKRIKKGGHGGHHGGAWKVAYADFVTAMMAFFLLLWLLNVTTDVQKRGIADYFEPSIASRSDMSGSGGILGGQAIGKPGALTQNASAPSIAVPIPAGRQLEDGDEGEEAGDSRPGKKPGDPKADKPGDPDKKELATGNSDKPVDKNGDKLELAAGNAEKKSDRKLDKVEEATAQKALAEREDKQFAQAEFALRQAIQDIPDLRNLAENLMIDRTPEGLRIQLVDQEKISMFPLGSSEMADSARKLMGLVAQVVQRLPNKISITGHTDATPFAKAGNYGNWELSADRANASRRALLQAGLSEERIAKVVGTADRDPLIVDQPTSPRNRRISVVLLRDSKPVPPGTLAQR
jgi:chemotaxis protein MotB